MRILNKSCTALVEKRIKGAFVPDSELTKIETTLRSHSIKLLVRKMRYLFEFVRRKQLQITQFKTLREAASQIKEVIRRATDDIELAESCEEKSKDQKELVQILTGVRTFSEKCLTFVLKEVQKMCFSGFSQDAE